MMEILKPYLFAFLGIATLLSIWIAVQSAWRKFFSETLTDEEVLARRNDCFHCVSQEKCNDPKK